MDAELVVSVVLGIGGWLALSWCLMGIVDAIRSFRRTNKRS